MAEPEREETELPQIVNLSRVCVESVEAELVRASQTIIPHLSAEEVELQSSAAGTIQTGDLNIRNSFVGAVASQQATVQDSIVGGLRAESLNFNGVTALAVADSMSILDVNAIVTVANNVQADNIRTGILISREVHGNVTTTLDTRTALLAGLTGGAVTGLILLAGKLLFGRKK